MGFQDFLKLIGAILAAIGGGGALVFALSSWLGKIWAERILNQDRHRYNVELEKVKSDYRQLVDSTLERLKDELGRSQFVHRLQFETEFNAYLELWSKVESARIAMGRFLGAEDDTKEDQYNELCAIETDIREWVFRHKPFLPRNVFAKVFDFTITLSGLSADPHQHVLKLDTSLVNAKCDDICEAIRERIGIIGVPDSGPVAKNVYFQAIEDYQQSLKDSTGTEDDVNSTVNQKTASATKS